MTEKTCKKCGTTKPLEQFVKARKCIDGRSWQCKACAKRYQDAYAERMRHRATIPTPPELTCLRCGATKTATEFVSNTRTKLGRLTVCKKCHAASMRTPEERERGRIRKRAWYEENPELKNFWCSEESAKKKGVKIVEHLHALVVLEMDDGVCGICGEDVDPLDYEIDHIIPLEKGGEHSYANVQVAHAGCNRRKQNRILIGD